MGTGSAMQVTRTEPKVSSGGGLILPAGRQVEDAISLPKLDGCQRVYLLPNDFAPPTPEGGVKWPDYWSITTTLASYAAMEAAEPTYGDYMRGHPGFPGGVPTLPAGFGLLFGHRDNRGTEFWLTDAEGLTDSAKWEPSTVSPAVVDGEWLGGVRGASRNILLRGTVLGVDRESTMLSVSEVVTSLSTQPRTGWLYWADATGAFETAQARRLPVVLNESMKVRWVDQRRCDIEVQCSGVSIGTLGRGVFFEAPESTTVDIEPRDDFLLVNEGTVPSPVILQAKGPLTAGSLVVKVGGYEVTFTKEILEDETVTVDSVSYRVYRSVFGQTQTSPARDYVDLLEQAWPMLTSGSNRVECSDWLVENDPQTGNPTNSVRLISGALW